MKSLLHPMRDWDLEKKSFVLITLMALFGLTTGLYTVWRVTETHTTVAAIALKRAEDAKRQTQLNRQLIEKNHELALQEAENARLTQERNELLHQELYEALEAHARGRPVPRRTSGSPTPTRSPSPRPQSQPSPTPSEPPPSQPPSPPPPCGPPDCIAPPPTTLP